MRLLVSLLLLVLWMTPTRAQDHPGWPTDELTAKAAELLKVDDVDLQVVTELPSQQFLLDPTEEMSCFVAPDDRLSFFAAGEFASIGLIGSAERVHTLWIVFPILSVRDQEGAFAFFEAFFAHLFPDWDDAPAWAMESLRASWEASGKAYNDPTISFNEMIVRHLEAGAKLTTWGVPPDIVFYRVTGRAGCEKISDYLLASPRRALRIESQRRLDQDVAQLRLTYIQREPIDVSATPAFLGRISGQKIGRSPEGVLYLDEPGPLPGRELPELLPWMEVAADSGFASTTDAIRDGWGYEHLFHFLINRPFVALNAGGVEHRLLVQDAMVDITGTIASGFAYRPRTVFGLLFASELPARPVDDRTADPPYMVVPPGDIRFMDEGTPIPVDVSATPIYVGAVGRSFDAPNLNAPSPVTAAIEGAIITISSGEESVALDLGEWLSRQTGTAFVPGRSRSISESRIPFELGGVRHLLVVTSAHLSPAGEGALNVRQLGGELFAER